MIDLFLQLIHSIQIARMFFPLQVIQPLGQGF